MNQREKHKNLLNVGRLEHAHKLKKMILRRGKPKPPIFITDNCFSFRLCFLDITRRSATLNGSLFVRHVAQFYQLYINTQWNEYYGIMVNDICLPLRSKSTHIHRPIEFHSSYGFRWIGLFYVISICVFGSYKTAGKEQ